MTEQFILNVTAENLPRFTGPFDSRKEAEDYAALNIRNGVYGAEPLTYPYLRSNDD